MEIPEALSDFSFVLVYLAAAALFALGPLIIAHLSRPGATAPPAMPPMNAACPPSAAPGFRWR